MSLEPVRTTARSGVRPWMIVTPLALLAVVGVAFVLVRGDGPGSVWGGGMQVELVAPVEPVIDAGGTMEVGDLVEGYSHVPLAPAEPAEVYDAGYQTAWVEPLPPLPSSPRPAWSSDMETPSPTPATTGPGGSYGFDTPGPDYAAERRARQDRLDRIQAEQTTRGVAGAPATSPGLDRDTAFY